MSSIERDRIEYDIINYNADLMVTYTIVNKKNGIMEEITFEKALKKASVEQLKMYRDYLVRFNDIMRDVKKGKYKLSDVGEGWGYSVNLNRKQILLLQLKG